MSVINKVLRDLDKRQGVAAAPTDAEQGVRQGTASIEMQGAAPQARRAPAAAVRRGALVVPALVLLLAGVGVGLWQSGVLETSAPPATQPVVAAVAVEGTTGPSASRFESSLVMPKDPKPATLPQAVPAPVVPPVKTIPQVASPLPTKAPAAVASMPVVTPPPSPAAENSTPALTPDVSPPATVPIPTPAELAQKQQLAARDALAQAQALWNAGSRDPAVDLLQQAVASTERTAQTSPGAGATQTLVLLVRELGRMQLAEGRPGAVWDTLIRTEPLLRNEPEMWALRANAAQRLGRHQDSVHAYMTALQSRPNEQRWVLGAAVSLAALGQTSSAAEMAERARTLGPISREVQTYLRQSGVPLKD